MRFEGAPLSSLVALLAPPLAASASAAGKSASLAAAALTTTTATSRRSSSSTSSRGVTVTAVSKEALGPLLLFRPNSFAAGDVLSSQGRFVVNMEAEKREGGTRDKRWEEGGGKLIRSSQTGEAVVAFEGSEGRQHREERLGENGGAFIFPLPLATARSSTITETPVNAKASKVLETRTNAETETGTETADRSSARQLSAQPGGNGSRKIGLEGSYCTTPEGVDGGDLNVKDLEGTIECSRVPTGDSGFGGGSGGGNYYYRSAPIANTGSVLTRGRGGLGVGVGVDEVEAGLRLRLGTGTPALRWSLLEMLR